MKKKILAALLIAAMGTTLLAGCGGSAEKSSKKVINVYAFTDEVPGMIEKYMDERPDIDYEINTTIVATTDGAYQPALDQALQAGGSDAPDIYCAESAFVLKYTQGDASEYASTYKDLGIDVDSEIEKADIAQYSVDIGTRTSDGEVVALGYQATGGAFIYRRSIAKDAFGTDDPDEVGNIIGAGTGSWDKFFEAAETLKSKNYAIISGDGDLWHPIENSSDQGWVVDGKLTIDSKREAFLDYSKELKDNGYHNDTQDWQDAWFADMAGIGEKPVLGFFGPAWLINYTIGQNCGDTAGDWAICNSPIGFFWGGTWILANKNLSEDEEKQAVVKDIIDWITLDCTEDGLQYQWANGTYDSDKGTKDAVASGTVMAMSDGTLDFLGGQNMFDVFVDANQYANGKNLTQYDETINQYWRDQVRSYTSGECTRDEAIDNFKQQVKDNLDVEVD